MARKLTYKETLARLNGAHYQIEGLVISSIHAVFQIAKDRGFDGALRTIQRRLEAGSNTWDEIARPVAQNRKASIAGSRKRMDREKEDMAKLIADLDARKKALAETTTPQPEGQGDEWGGKVKAIQFLAGVLGAVAIIALAIFLWLAAVALTVEHVLDRSDRFECSTTTDPSTRPGSEGKRDA